MKFGLGPSTEKNGIPRIESVAPAAAIPGGEVEIRGSGFVTRTHLRPAVRFGETEAPLALASPQRLVARVSAGGRSEQWIEGMGVATGLAFDRDQNLYVGDRSGTIFKISPTREIFVFATLEPSVAAYHLAFHPSGELYATGPTTSSFDRVYRISQGGDVTTFFRGLGRPQGLAFDRDGNLFVAASLGGRRGIIRITPSGRAELALSGAGIVGMEVLPTGRA